MNKRGFTLVELLSVIVILGVIAFITVPVVSSVITNAHEKSYKVQVNIILDGARKWAINNYNEIGSEPIYITINKLISSGNIEQEELINPRTSEPMTGCVKIEYSSIYNQYDYSYVEDCTSHLTKYNDGYVVNFNPETGTICDTPVSTTGTKTGCMKWYVINDSLDEYKVSLLLDHNTSPLTKWVTLTDYVAAGSTSLSYGTNGNNSLGAITLKSLLNSDTATWNKSLNPRIITANEIAKVTSHTWNSKTATTGFNLDTFTPNSSTPSEYAFLFDNLYDTTNHGGTNQDNTSYNLKYYEVETKTTYDTWNYQLGYWTIDKVSNLDTSAWVVTNEGILTNSQVSVGNYGLRPVIEIYKSLLNN